MRVTQVRLDYLAAKRSSSGIHEPTADSTSPRSDYVLMMRRLSSLVTCFLVLTFSIPGANVCDGMVHESNPHNAAHQVHGGDVHHLPVHSQPHQTSHKGAPSDHCQTSTTCTAVVFAGNVLLPRIDFSHVDRVAREVAAAPSSQSPDLEPPPPKA